MIAALGSRAIRLEPALLKSRFLRLDRPRDTQQDEGLAGFRGVVIGEATCLPFPSTTCGTHEEGIYLLCEFPVNESIFLEDP